MGEREEVSAAKAPLSTGRCFWYCQNISPTAAICSLCHWIGNQPWSLCIEEFRKGFLDRLIWKSVSCNVDRNLAPTLSGGRIGRIWYVPPRFSEGHQRPHPRNWKGNGSSSGTSIYTPSIEGTLVALARFTWPGTLGLKFFLQFWHLAGHRSCKCDTWISWGFYFFSTRDALLPCWTRMLQGTDLYGDQAG